MPQYVFEPAPRPSIAVVGSDRLVALRRVYCVARNYAQHAREMGADPTREPPFFFSKPADAVVSGDCVIPYPPASEELHHEVELVVVLGRAGQRLEPAEALDCVYGYAVGIDLTRRDLQRAAKHRGRPWDAAKGFDRSAPVSAVRPASEIGHPDSGAITLAVNGALRQRGDLREQIWRVPEVLQQLSRLFALEPGDLVFTGTPAGVGSLAAGDRIDAAIEGIGNLSVEIAPST